MSIVRRAAIQRLASNAQEQGLEVVQGIVEHSAEGWKIGAYNLVDWLAAHEGEEIITVLGTLENGVMLGGISAEIRTCRKCGRDYNETECPHCRHQRQRIRGH